MIPAHPADPMHAPMHPTTSPQHAIAAALRDPSLPVPAGLRAWNGSDPQLRFAVHRNNVMHGLVSVLGDSFPVVRQLVGDDFFSAMASVFVMAQPPTSPLMHHYGHGFPGWVAGFEPAAALPYLADLARLEWLRLAAFHAADADPIDARRLAAVLQAPERLAVAVLVLHPGLAVVQSAHPVVSLWAAHQHDEAQRDRQLGRLCLDAAESALILRAGDDALVLELPAADAALAAALAAGMPLGAAQAAHPQADLAGLLALLLRHGQVIDLTCQPANAPGNDRAAAHRSASN